MSFRSLASGTALLVLGTGAATAFSRPAPPRGPVAVFPAAPALPEALVTARFAHFDPLPRRAFRKTGELAAGWRVAFDRGFRVAWAERLEGGQVRERWTFEYEPGGGPRAGYLRRADGAPLETWTWNARGQLAKRAYHQGYPAVYRFVTCHYAESGALILEKEYVQDKLLGIVLWAYAPDGAPRLRSWCTPEGNPMGRSHYRVDARGRIVEELVYQWGKLARVLVWNWAPEGYLETATERQIDPRRDPADDPSLDGLRPDVVR